MATNFTNTEIRTFTERARTDDNWKELQSEYVRAMHWYDFQIVMRSRQMLRVKNDITFFFTKYDETVLQTIEHHLDKIEPQRFGHGPFLYDDDKYRIRAIKPSSMEFKVEALTPTGLIFRGFTEDEDIERCDDDMYEDWCDVSMTIYTERQAVMGVGFSDKGRETAIKVIENYFNERRYLITLPHEDNPAKRT